MPDTTTDQVAAALAQIRERIAPLRPTEYVSSDRLAGEVSRLLAALEAVLELADEWGDMAAVECPDISLRETIASKLLGEEVGHE